MERTEFAVEVIGRGYIRYSPDGSGVLVITYRDAADDARPFGPSTFASKDRAEMIAEITRSEYRELACADIAAQVVVVSRRVSIQTGDWAPDHEATHSADLSR